MRFDDILKDVGGFGRYQKALVIGFMIPCFTVMPWFTMHPVFITAIPEHWCYVPELVNSDLSESSQRKLIQPPTDPGCSRYDVNYTEILLSEVRHLDPQTPTVPCDKGWQYDHTYYEETAVTKWDLVCKDDYFVPLIISSTFIGIFIGAPLFWRLSEKLGRKPSFLIAATVVALTDVGSALSPHFTLLIILRITEGTAVATVYTNAYIIILELVTTDMNTRMNGISTVSWTAGMCMVPMLAWYTRDWVKLCGISSGCAAGLLLYWKCLPEAPSWLVAQKRYADATEIMTRISKCNGKTVHEDKNNPISQRIQDLAERSAELTQKIYEYSFLDLFKHPTLRKRFLLIIVCWVCNSMPFFGLMMNTRNLDGNQFINFFLACAAEIPAHFATWILIEHVGRRKCVLCAFAISAVSLFLPFPLQDYAETGIIVTFLAKASTSSAYMTLYVQGPELLPLSLREIGIGICCTAGTGAAIVTPYVVYLAKYGDYIPFVVYSGLMVIALICACFLPETLNKALPLTIYEAENFEKDWSCCICTSCHGDVNDGHSAMNDFPSTINNANSEKQTQGLPGRLRNKSASILIRRSGTCPVSPSIKPIE